MSPECPCGQPRVSIAVRPATCVGPGGQHDWDHSNRCLGHPTSLNFWGGLGFVIRGPSGHKYADAYEHSRHGPWDWHKAGDCRPDWDYDRRDHREFAPRSSPRSPSMSDLQLFWMESALSWAARDWHGGYRGLVVDGVQELTENDFRALHVPPDTRISIIDIHFEIMSAYTRLDSYHRP
jgi:hypothetical protein